MLLISDLIFAITFNLISFELFVMILYCLVCRNISFTLLSKFLYISVTICKFQSFRPTSYCFVCRWRSGKADSRQKVDISKLRCYLLKYLVKQYFTSYNMVFFSFCVLSLLCNKDALLR